MKILTRLFTLASIAFLIFIGNGCSSSDPQVKASGEKADTQTNSQMEESAVAAEPVAESFPVTLQTATGEVSLEMQPMKILSLSPTATEILFAIGAGEQVFAVDDQSNYPPEAPISDISVQPPRVIYHTQK